MPATPSVPPPKSASSKEHQRSPLAKQAAVRHRRKAITSEAALEFARSIVSLREQGYSQTEIGTMLGFSDQAISDYIRLIEGTAATVLAAVEEGALAATTAIMLARQVPERGRQTILLAEAKRHAQRAGAGRISAKHFSLPMSSRRFRQHTDAVHRFKLLVDSLPPTADSAERRMTARRVADFLDGKCSGEELKDFLIRRPT